MRLLVLALFLGLTACASAPPDRLGGGLVGTWRLETTQAFDVEGALVYAPEVDTGLLVVTPTHYSLLWTRAPRPPAAAPWAATEAERLRSFATMIAHAGRYRLDGDRLTVAPEAAKSPEFVGGVETFQVRVDGDTLRLTATHAEAADGTVVPFYAASGRQDYRFTRVE